MSSKLSKSKALSKLDVLKEACENCFMQFKLDCKKLTLLANACHEAAAYRTEHKLPHVEKYVNMEEILNGLEKELDIKIDNECERLLAKHRSKHAVK